MSAYICSKNVNIAKGIIISGFLVCTLAWRLVVVALAAAMVLVPTIRLQCTPPAKKCFWGV